MSPTPDRVMVLSSLFAVTPAASGMSPLGAGLLIAGVLLLAVALVVQGERLAALRRDLESLRHAHAEPAEATASPHGERAMFGSLYDEPEPSAVEQVVVMIRAEPVRVATAVGVVAIIAGLTMLGRTAPASNVATASSAEIAQLRAAHDSLRTALAFIASGAATPATIAASPAPESAVPAAAERPAPARRVAPQPAVAARPAPRSPAPSAAILPPPPRVGAGALPAAPLPAAPTVSEAQPVLPPRP